MAAELSRTGHTQLPVDVANPNVQKALAMWGASAAAVQAEIAEAEAAAEQAREAGRIAEAEVRSARATTIYVAIIATHALHAAGIEPDVNVYDANWVESRRTMVQRARDAGRSLGAMVLPKLERPAPPPTRPVLYPAWRIFDMNGAIHEAHVSGREPAEVDSYNRTLVLSADPNVPYLLSVAQTEPVTVDGKEIEQLHAGAWSQILPNPTLQHFYQQYPSAHFSLPEQSRRILAEQTSGLVAIFEGRVVMGHCMATNPWQARGDVDMWPSYRNHDIEGQTARAIADYLARRGLTPEMFGYAVQQAEAMGVRQTVEDQAGANVSGMPFAKLQD